MGNSSDNTGDATAPKEGGQRRRLCGLPGCLVAIGMILLVFVGLPYAFLVLAFWSAEGSWDFEGDKSFRYWIFVGGKRAEKLGVVAPTDKPVQYSVSLPDGNFPGWAIVSYESNAAPEAVIEAYAKRCEGLKAKVTRRPAPEQKDDTIAARLECEFAGYLTAEFSAERNSASSVSEVGLRVWGRE